MSLEANKALIRRFYDEVWNKGNVAVIDDISPRITSATTSAPVAHRPGRRARAIARLFGRLPDLK
jgi:hypothetical protein